MTNGQQKLLSFLSSPPLKNKSLPVECFRFYTDAGGTIIDKSLVPAPLQTDYPLFIFGEFDRIGGYYAAQKAVPILTDAYVFLTSFIVGAGIVPFGFFSGLNDIQTRLKTGDIVQVYTDSLQAPGYFIYIVTRLSSYSLASIQANAKADNSCRIKIEEFQYFTNNQNQWKKPLRITSTNFLGRSRTDDLDSFAYFPPSQAQAEFVLVPLVGDLIESLGINTYIDFDTDSMLLNFKLKI